MVLSTHGGFFHTKRLSQGKRLYYGTLLPQIIRRYDYIVASSPNDYGKLQRLHPRVIRIDNGIDVDDFSSIATPVDGAPTFCYIGRFTYSVNKRIDRLIETFALLHRKGVPFTLHLVGPYSDELATARAAISRHGMADKVIICVDADQKTLKDALAASTYFVTATEYEGFGLSSIEAMAAGRLPLLSRIQPFTDYIENGRNGFILDFTAPEKAATQIGEVMALSLGEKQAIAARAKEFSRGFSWSARVREFDRCYRLAIDHYDGRSSEAERAMAEL
jgi:alpha-1,3-mannosyltransferase